MKTLIPALHEKSTVLRAEIAALDKLEKDIAAEQNRQQSALAAINAEEDRPKRKRTRITPQSPASHGKPKTSMNWSKK